MMKQLEYNSLTCCCLYIKKMKLHKRNGFIEIANEILFVGDILQSFQLEPIFTAAEI